MNGKIYQNGKVIGGFQEYSETVLETGTLPRSLHYLGGVTEVIPGKKAVMQGEFISKAPLVTGETYECVLGTGKRFALEGFTILQGGRVVWTIR